MPFEDWNLGEDLFNELDKEHDLLDRDVRPFAEECDQLRALQIFTSSDDAWGGFTARRIHQTAKLKRETNKARSVYSMSPEATMYTPIIDPPSRLPSTIRVDNNSEWYTSALTSIAMESITLPTRLRPYQNFESLLAGDDSTRRIFELQASIVPPAKDHRNVQRQASKQPNKVESCKSGSMVQVLRGLEPDDKEEELAEADLGFVRKMRVYKSEPMFHRFHTPLQYPLLDSFPSDMITLSMPENKLSIISALTTSTRTAEKIKNLESVAGRLITVDERENLVNGLGEIRESYETGWISDSDFDDD
ncbi:hypothetical protein AN0848.2 [Aspergillus nidulans FGSC A4]|nr:hypothetical protein AN0848.2 [Aspergillus nidulans FGSC A4]|eukprot:XP_658452.1 hypothetical protein AN0848.2 [Aspergillus nidulans FGSC A4]